MILIMSSQHRFPARTFRPEPGEYADAQADLTARGKEMDAFLRACLRWLHRDPDRFLATLAPAWPSPRPRGRPSGPQATFQVGPVAHQRRPEGHEHAPSNPGRSSSGDTGGS
jgi:hypothetical protein